MKVSPGGPTKWDDVDDLEIFNLQTKQNEKEMRNESRREYLVLQSLAHNFTPFLSLSPIYSTLHTPSHIKKKRCDHCFQVMHLQARRMRWMKRREKWGKREKERNRTDLICELMHLQSVSHIKRLIAKEINKEREREREKERKWQREGLLYLDHPKKATF